MFLTKIFKKYSCSKGKHDFSYIDYHHFPIRYCKYCKHIEKKYIFGWANYGLDQELLHVIKDLNVKKINSKRTSTHGDN
jgi:hypothetical protein